MFALQIAVASGAILLNSVKCEVHQLPSLIIAAGTYAWLHVVVLGSAPSVTVHLVPHTHDDVGWLKTVDENRPDHDPTRGFSILIIPRGL